MHRIIIRFLLGGAIAYGLVLSFIFIQQESMIFKFAPVDLSYAYDFQHDHEFVWIDRPDGARLHGVIFRTSESRRGLVLYYKGNAGNISRSERMADTFLSLGFDVLSMDYRGFGKSRGAMSEAALLSDAEAWYDFAQDYAAPHPVRVVGYSLGSTFASHVAAYKKVSDVILFAPMKSVLDLGQRRYPFVPAFISQYPLRSDLKLKKAVKARITIFHGTDDTIVPLQSGQGLKSVLNGDDDFIILEGATHNSVPWADTTLNQIRALWGQESSIGHIH